MGVMKTDQWVRQLYEQPLSICKKLIPYFKGATPREIYQYLLFHGMYRLNRYNKERITSFCTKNFWKIIEKEFILLKKEWAGPDIPIFIFPVDYTNQELLRSFNGKSGLAFDDKLFLFLSDKNEEIEIKALFTHEYNHVCRLNKSNKAIEEHTLLDSLILEGLAESAVKERFGENHTASWTKLYTEKQILKMWQKFILPNKDLKKRMKAHDELLYGTKMFYPKLCGYVIGYYIIQQCLKNTSLRTKDLLFLPSNEIIKRSQIE